MTGSIVLFSSRFSRIDRASRETGLRPPEVCRPGRYLSACSMNNLGSLILSGPLNVVRKDGPSAHGKVCGKIRRACESFWNTTRTPGCAPDDHSTKVDGRDGGSTLTKTHGDAVIQMLSQSAESRLARSGTQKLAKLGSDIELGTLDALIDRLEANAWQEGRGSIDAQEFSRAKTL